MHAGYMQMTVCHQIYTVKYLLYSRWSNNSWLRLGLLLLPSQLFFTFVSRKPNGPFHYNLLKLNELLIIFWIVDIATTAPWKESQTKFVSFWGEWVISECILCYYEWSQERFWVSTTWVKSVEQTIYVHIYRTIYNISTLIDKCH